MSYITKNLQIPQVDDEIMAISEFCVFITVSVYYVLIFYYLPLLAGLYILCNLYNLLWLVVPHCGKLYRVMRVYRQKMRKLGGNKYHPVRGVLPECAPAPSYDMMNSFQTITQAMRPNLTRSCWETCTTSTTTTGTCGSCSSCSPSAPGWRRPSASSRYSTRSPWVR